MMLLFDYYYITHTIDVMKRYNLSMTLMAIWNTIRTTNTYDNHNLIDIIIEVYSIKQ